jgi:hypothetical protein
MRVLLKDIRLYLNQFRLTGGRVVGPFVGERVGFLVGALVGVLVDSFDGLNEGDNVWCVVK